MIKKIILSTWFFIAALTSTAQLNKQQQEIKKTFFDFLRFYKTNEKKFNAFKLYKGKNDAPPFKIQWKEVEKYFTYLRTNVPYVGEAYIKAEKAHFKFADSCFKANPTDEIAAGFDYDRWAGGQEDIAYTYKYYTAKSNTYVVKIIGNTATLKIGSKLNKNDAEAERSWSIVPFVKEKGKWVMADNIYPAN